LALPEPRAQAATASTASGLDGVPAEPGVPKPDPILVVDGIKRVFGGLTAVNVDHMEVPAGHISALIGPNGAGKTTFFNLLTGFDRPNAGTSTFEGRSLNNVAAYKIARRGMVRTFQLTKALARLTVMENMKLGATHQRGESFGRALFPPLWRRQESEIERRADRLLERFKMAHMRDEFAGTLSGGQRKLLEMARALMSSPSLVMLDEPMAGVNPALKQSLLDHIREVLQDGTTVLFVEHDMDVVRDISDWVFVMAEGRLIAEGPAESIGQNQAVVDAYLGAHHDAPLSFEEEERQLRAAEQAIAEQEEQVQS
jgi:branched-chain amino acid transport system ATP-binding protein